MSACCQHLYEAAFDTRLARKELEDYRAAGVKKSSRPFLDVLGQLPLEGHTLLDIGGGIGAVAFELFKRGIRHATHVDISSAYVQVFSEEAKHRRLAEKVHSLHGDFLDLHHHIPAADLVTLDKVICCYEDYSRLVETSAAKARRWYLYSIPRDVWWVRSANWIERMIDRLKGRYFRTYYHPAAKIEALLATNGFRKKEEKIQREWRIFLFEKGIGTGR